MNKYTKLILGLGAFTLAVWLVLVFKAQKTDATVIHYKHLHAECQINDSEHPCYPGLVCTPFNEESGNGKCENLNPTATPSVTPSVTPFVCDEQWQEDCVGTPTPTVTPSPTPTETVTEITPVEENHPQFAQGAPESPTCHDFVTPTLLTFTRLSPTSVKITWSHTDPINQYIVYFGLQENKLDWNTGIVNGWETILDNLPANQNIWVGVRASDNNCVGNLSNVLDP